MSFKYIHTYAWSYKLVEIKYNGESITHKFQELVDLLTTQSIDFMGVEKFDFIFKMLLNSCCKSIERQWKEILSYNISRIQVSTSDIVIENI